jgi:hypothetical protein
VQFHVVGFAVLPRAEAPEILAGFGSEVVEELEDDPACPCCAYLHVYVDFVVGLGTHFIIDDAEDYNNKRVFGFI